MVNRKQRNKVFHSCSAHRKHPSYFEVIEGQQITRRGAAHVRKPPGFLVALGRVFVRALALQNGPQGVVGMRGRGVELKATLAEVL